LTFGFRIRHADGPTLAEGETRHVCAGLDDKPKRPPHGLSESVAPFLRSRDDAS
jgi:hypothetical protein